LFLINYNGENNSNDENSKCELIYTYIDDQL